jgi:hypothetical protein
MIGDVWQCVAAAIIGGFISVVLWDVVIPVARRRPRR